MTARRTAALLTGLVVVLQLLGMQAASASQDVPFHDDAAKGYLGLCNASGKQITSGSIDMHPFVTKAVSSLAAPKDFGPQVGGKASVYAFQPRRGVEPADWSGRQLTAASFYSQPSHPSAAGTELDYSLADFLSVYPANWDGLLQLRMFLTAPNRPAILYPYATTTIRVTGSRWTVVQGGTVDCAAGKAKSSELTSLSAAQFHAQLAAVRKQRAVKDVKASAPGSKPNGGSSGNSSGAARNGGSVSAGPGRISNAARTSADRKSDGGSSVALWVVVALAALVLISGGAAVWRRRTGHAES